MTKQTRVSHFILGTLSAVVVLSSAAHAMGKGAQKWEPWEDEYSRLLWYPPALNDDGTIRLFTKSEAEEYCKSLGLSLPAPKDVGLIGMGNRKNSTPIWFRKERSQAQAFKHFFWAHNKYQRELSNQYAYLIYESYQETTFFPRDSELAVCCVSRNAPPDQATALATE